MTTSASLPNHYWKNSAYVRSCMYRPLTGCSSVNVIPLLTLGLSLSSPYLTPEQLDSFMRRMLVSRLSRRVLAEHHLALSDQVRGRCRRKPHDDHEGHVGVISTSLHVQTCVDKCTRWLRSSWMNLGMGKDVDRRAWPEVIVDGHANARLSYIREHLE
jgi:pyruvate dehydrogenase kinase 2/3/4